MGYDDPPEWRGRGASGREGWPTYGGGGRPGSPRKHRAPDRWDEPTTDTGIDRERFQHNQPPYESPPPIIHVFEREAEGIARTAAWIGVIRDTLAIMTMLAALWLLGSTISHGGIPLWLPSK